MNKTFWAIIAIIVVIFGGILIFRNNDSGNSGGSSNAKPTQHTTGQGQSGVVLMEYADYQCPFCGQMFPIVKQVVDKYQQQITYQFRNLPLTQIHQNAFAAARAAEAAGYQNKFWEMHDLIYENQSSWSSSSNALATFTEFAKQLGLNTTQFKQDFSSAKVNDAINGDINAFKQTKESMSTPTFFVDGKKVEPTPTSVDDFSKVIDAAIAAKAQKS